MSRVEALNKIGYLRVGMVVALALLALSLPIVGRAQSKPDQTPPATSIFVVVHIDLEPQYADRGASLLSAYSADSQREHGSLYFRVLRQIGAPNHFSVVEEWADKNAYDAHISSTHALQFRTQIQPWLGSPFDERLHTLLK